MTDLVFADDSTVLAEDDAEATDALYKLTRTAESYGFKINTDKMTTDGSPANVYLNDRAKEGWFHGRDPQSNRSRNCSIRFSKVVLLEANQYFHLDQNPPFLDADPPDIALWI